MCEVRWRTTLLLDRQVRQDRKGRQEENARSGRDAITGSVTLEASGDIEIFYPHLGVRDFLRPVSPGVYLGWTKPGRTKVFFLLTKVEK